MNSRHYAEISSVKTFRFLPLLLAAVLLAACGSGSSAPKVQTGDVAEVATEHITTAQFQAALAEAEASAKSQGQAIPTPGSSGYGAMRTAVVDDLVQQAELELQADKLGVSVSDAAVQSQMAKLKKTNFKGSDKAYNAELKKEHVTDADVRDYVRQALLSQKIYNAVTKGTTVPASAIAAYYAANISQYEQKATRSVEEILVGKNEKLANQLYAQLKGGADFATTAKKYSKDPGSKNQGGKYTATQGNDVPEFDAAVFAPSAKTGVLLKPVNTKQYGWFLIQPLAAITPAKTTPEPQAAAAIRKQLLSTKAQQVATTWMKGVEKGYCSGGSISYGTGYAPSPDPCASLSSPPPTTT
jgi:parvulin-like peptidyl-prolyl isomerase